MSRNYGSALADCKIENGFIEVNGMDAIEFGNTLRKDLKDMLIPHFRPIGVTVTNALNANKDYISKINGINMSYVELLIAFKNVVPISAGGVLPPNLDSDKRIFGSCCSNAREVYTGDKSIIFSKSGQDKIPHFLIEEIPIVKHATDDFTLHFIFMRHQGFIDFDESQRYLRGTGYKPLRAVYDLNDYVSVGYNVKGNKVPIFFKRKINVEGLETILRAYGEDLLVQEAMSL